MAAASALLLAGCGAAGATTPTGAGGGTSLSAAPARCTPASRTTTCTVEVTYANLGATPLTIDAGLTQLVDAQGIVRRALPSGATSGLVLPAGEKVAITWSVDLDEGEELADVRWVDPAGSTSSVPLSVVTVTPAAPAPTPTPTPTPTPVVTPKPKPTPTPTRTRTRTSSPRPASPAATGSIG